MIVFRVVIILTTITVILVTFCCYRISVILDRKRHKPWIKKPTRDSKPFGHLLIVLGSGGHTAEMLAMLEKAIAETDESRLLVLTAFRYRTWVSSSGDELSAQRARTFEDGLLSSSADSSYMIRSSSKDEASQSPPRDEDVQILTVPRARKIHQSLLTAPISSLQCLFACLSVLAQCSNPERDMPDIILCNGPATATILVLAALLLRFFDVRGCHSRGKMRTVYVESWARVRKLSLSGKLLEWVVDRFIVQWPQLASESARYRRLREYLGVLV
jgi:beta-1,4-N-acetylglucosaminyltransferase